MLSNNENNLHIKKWIYFPFTVDADEECWQNEETAGVKIFSQKFVKNKDKQQEHYQKKKKKTPIHYFFFQEAEIWVGHQMQILWKTM